MPRPAPRRWGRVLAAAGGAAAMLSALRALGGERRPAALSARDATARRVRASNEYTETHGAAGRGYPWLRDATLVEPYRDTKLWVDGDDGDDGDDARLVWAATQVSNLAGGAAAEAHAHVGAVATWQFETLGAHAVEVRRGGAGGFVAASTVVCRYVRRNIRRLSAEDRARFFDAFAAMHGNSTSAGRAAYGDAFKSLDHFVRIHLNLAAGRDVDQLHDGMGFLTQHVALSNAFEKALQAVAPRLALPYWDVTEDSTLAVTRHGGDVAGLWASEVWRDDWFGNATGSAAHVVERGRFAYQTVGRGASGGATNPYGLLRAPWNVNKSPYLTRAHTFCGESFSLSMWPSCAAHYNFTFHAAYDAWYDYVWAAGYSPHGPVHYFVGGYVNCAGLEERFGGLIDADGARSLALLLLGVPKNLWRDGYVESPSYCAADAEQTSCHLVCAGEPSDATWAAEMMVILLHYAELFSKTGLDIKYEWLERMAPSNYTAFLDVFCTMAWAPGEQMEAASPADVSFWPIHPAMERLLQYKMLARPFTSLAWTDSAGPYCEYTGTCKGHHGFDVTAFANAHLDAASGEFREAYLTNGELLAAIDPNDYRMPYIYENFEWPHCAAEHGVAFPSV